MLSALKVKHGARVRMLALLACVAASGAAGTAAAKDFLDVRARDQCDPVTFGALCPGPRFGGVTLQEFQAALPAGGHGAWKFNPGPSGGHVDAGGAIQVRSDAGETHTFTKVAAFGGGFVPALNVAVGNATTAPECVPNAPPAPGAVSLVVSPSGGPQVLVAGGAQLPRGIHLFQCCIHPWMRTIITVR